MYLKMKGKKWYTDPNVAEEYEPKRFSGAGGSYIDQCEKHCVKSAIGDVEGKKVLEIAAGTGRFSLMLASMGVKVTACDISEPMLDIARKKAKEKGLDESVDFFRGDAERLPFEDDTFDLVVAIRFMHLVDHPEKFLREMARVSRDRVVFDTFSLSSLRIFYNNILPMDSRLYSDEEVEELADAVGLKIEGSRESFVVPFAVYRYVPDMFADAVRDLDHSMLNKEAGRKLASVIYWTMRIR